MTHAVPSAPIAIVGVSAIFPGSVARDGFWRDIIAGRDLIEDVPPTHWRIDDYYDPDPAARDKVYAKRGGFLSEITFDAMKWGIPPTIVPATDTTQLLALIAAQRVLDDATRGQFDDALRERTSVILGVTSAQELLGNMVSRLQRPVWAKALREMGLPDGQIDEACNRIADHYVEWQESTFPGVLGNVIAGRIANRLDLGGTNCVTDAACASSFSAISMGIQELRLGDSDLVIAGGADTMNDIFMYMCFSKTPALSPTGDCRPFSEQADGTLLGEGLGLFALKRLEDAERAGDEVYAILRGLGASSDGRAKSVYAPVARGQARALARAYAQAGYSPATVGLVEAHGTGTKAGDAAEFEGLSTIFAPERPEAPAARWCALGSIKSQIGHTKAAAGAAGLFKAVMALHHRALPPTIKVDAPHPELKIEHSPFYLNTEARPWIRRGHPRRAGVSAFGFGGSNFHVTVEEYTGPKRPPRLRTRPWELVVLGAAESEGVVAALQELRAQAAAHPGWTFWAHESQRRFDAAAPCRLAVLVESDAHLQDQLQSAEKMVAAGEAFRSPTGIYFGRGETAGGVAALFPGQGSQYVGMGMALALDDDDAMAVWDRAEQAVDGLAEVVFPPPAFSPAERATHATRLRSTEWAQPALAATSMALWHVLRRLALPVEAVAGHSFGEVMALYAAGAFDEEGALAVARRRGALMAEASAHTAGAMTSVKATYEEVGPYLPEEVVIANHNAPRQVVISGPQAAIEEAEARLAEAGHGLSRLEVATAFHSPVVAGAVAPFRAFLEEVTARAPQLPVWANATAEVYPVDAAAVGETLAAQLASSVRFVDTVEGLYAEGIRTFVEVGPGHVLTQLVTRILDGRPHQAIALDRRGRDGRRMLLDGIAQLTAAGVVLDFEGLWDGVEVPEDPREATAPQMPLVLTGTTYGKRYPLPDDAGGVSPAAAPRRRAPETKQAMTERAEHTGSAPPRLESEAGDRSAPAPEVRARVAPAADSATPPRTDKTAWGPVAAESGRPAAAAPSELVAAFEIAQRQAAEAQERFQQTLAESHAQYLQESRASLEVLAQLLGQDGVVRPMDPGRAEASTAFGRRAEAPNGGLVARGAEGEPLQEAPSPVTPTLDRRALMLEVVSEATGYPAEMLGWDMDLEADLGIDSIKRVEILSSLKKRIADLPDVPTREIAKLTTLGAVADAYGVAAGEGEVPSSAAAAPDVAPSSDVRGVLLAAVADKTGYPADMLGMAMDLEADLGIDSIKRVEILAAVRKAAPLLPEVPARELSALRTLGEVVARLEAAQSPAGAPSASPAASAPAAVPVAAAGAPLARRTVGRVPLPLPGVATSRLRDCRRLVVTDDGAGEAAAIAAALVSHGLPAAVVTSPDEAAGADGLVWLPRPDADDVAQSRDAIRFARAVAPTVKLFVTVQQTGGAFAGYAPSAGAVALARTAAREWPEATVRALDVEERVADTVVEELLFGGDTLQVGRGMERLTLVDAAAPLAPEAPTMVRDGDVVLATGGARGVTAVALHGLAERARGEGMTLRFALIGRSPLVDEDDVTRACADDAALKRALLAEHRRCGREVTPAALGREVATIVASREVRATLEGLGDARYYPADVTDRVALSEAVAAAEAELGPVSIVVHGAGVLADRAIADKTDAQIERVLGTKLRGLDAVLEATKRAPLRALLLFSSVAARYGNAGQCDYAMANELLDRRAASLATTRGILVRSLAWGPWRGGMVGPELAAHFTARGVALIEPAAGAAAFVDELREDAETAVVLGPELPGPPPTPVRQAVDVVLDAASHPYLTDHRIDGRVVLPIATAVEVFLRAMRALRPDETFARLTSVRVLRGLVLGDEVASTWLRVQSEPDADPEALRLTLLDAQGQARYRARAELRREPAEALVAPSGPAGPAAIYGGNLFHGPALQVLAEVETLTPEGATARLEHRLALSGFAVDVGLLDGALQLALVAAQVGGRSLPTSLAAIDVHREGRIDGSAAAVLVVRDRDGTTGSVTSDVLVSDAEGPILSLRGVETHRRPDPPQPALSQPRL